MNPKFYAVGGFIRDMLLDRKSNDKDYVVVGATPEWMLANGYKQVGADFPVFLDKDGVEYALARTERKSGKGYHGFVTSHDTSVTLEDDLRRRDLTINAMAMTMELDDENNLVDPFDGKTDCYNKILRHVSEAFREDPVRVLRVARFNAQFGASWSIDANTVALAKTMAEAGELNHLTKERIWKEFEKVLHTNNVHLFLIAMKNMGALKIVFPSFDKYFNQLIAILNVVRLKVPTDWKHSPKERFATMMTIFNPATVEKFCEDYRIPLEYKDYAVFHAKLSRKIRMKHFLSPRIVVDMLNELGIYRNNYWMLDGPWVYPHLILLKNAYDRTKDVGFNNLTEEQRNTLKGKDIMTAINELRAKNLE